MHFPSLLILFNRDQSRFLVKRRTFFFGSSNEIVGVERVCKERWECFVLGAYCFNLSSLGAFRDKVFFPELHAS